MMLSIHTFIVCIAMAGSIAVMGSGSLSAESPVHHSASAAEAAWVHGAEPEHVGAPHVGTHSMSPLAHDGPTYDDQFHDHESYEVVTDAQWAHQGAEWAHQGAEWEHQGAEWEHQDPEWEHQGHGSACDACGSHKCGCYGVDTDPGRPRKPCRTMPGDRNRGDCPPLRYRMDDQQRSGHSEAVAPWAKCGRKNTKYGKYTAWFVGGGATFANVPTLPFQLLSRGRDRKAIACGQHGEGTWGLDYEGLGSYSKVWLKYTQGRKQGGEGRYETDGEPKLIAKIKEKLHHK